MAAQFTVVERVVALGYEPEKNLTWAVGDAARVKWQKLTDSLPAKELRPKTSGAGSHCLAVYPDEFRPEIDGIVEAIAREMHAQDVAQGSLF